MAKFGKDDKLKGSGKKRVIIVSLIVILFLLAITGGYFLGKNYADKNSDKSFATGYGMGYNKSLQDVAQAQAQSGTIIVWQDNSIQILSLQDICNAVA
jgi:flagellar basal body-associated protein FliL